MFDKGFGVYCASTNVHVYEAQMQDTQTHAQRASARNIYTLTLYTHKHCTHTRTHYGHTLQYTDMCTQEVSTYICIHTHTCIHLHMQSIKCTNT